MILATPNVKQLARNIGKQSGQSMLPYRIGTFPDGERWYKLLFKRRPSSVHLVGNITADPVSLFDLLALAKAAQDNGIAVKSLVVPYLGYTRQDKVFERGEACLGEMVARLVSRILVPRLYFLSLHSEAVRDYLDPHEEIDGLSVIRGQIRSRQYDSIVAPDHGAQARAEAFASPQQDVLVLPKRRTARKQVSRPPGIPSVRGKRVLIVDDMISTGQTILTAVSLLRKGGAKSIDVAAVHSVWAKQAGKLLLSREIRKIFLTDTLPTPHHRKVQTISVASALADHLQASYG